jgi:hypothetical protein
MTATETQTPETITLPADLMHRLLDRLEGQEKSQRRETTTSRLELAVTGLCVLGILLDAFVLEPWATKKAMGLL